MRTNRLFNTILKICPVRDILLGLVIALTLNAVIATLIVLYQP